MQIHTGINKRQNLNLDSRIKGGEGATNMGHPQNSFTYIICFMGFPGGSEVRNLPAIPETWFDLWVAKIPWRRKWQPALVFLPEKSPGQRSLVS